MAFPRTQWSKPGPSSPIIFLVISIAAIAFLFLVSSPISASGFCLSSPKALESRPKVKNMNQNHQTGHEKHLYWGDRVVCPGKHRESCVDLGQRESSLRCALAEKIMVAPRRRSLELIPNEGTRKMTFRKRKKSLYKKADELSKLCDIDVCLIVYEADQKKGRAVQPETWPRDPTQFKRILNKYKDSKDISAPGLKRNFDMSDFYEDKKDQVDDDDEKFQNLGKKIFEEEYQTKFQNLGKKISEEEYPTWDDRIDDFSQDELTNLIASLESKIQVATKRIDSMERYMGFAKKQNQSLVREETNHDEQPYQVPALSSPPSLVHYPMLPSAWVSSSESEKS